MMFIPTSFLSIVAMDLNFFPVYPRMNERLEIALG